MMLKMLVIIPKHLRIYVREGIIFNSMKTVKSIWRNAVKKAANYSKFIIRPSTNSYQQHFHHMAVILSVISKNSVSRTVGGKSPISQVFRFKSTFVKGKGNGLTGSNSGETINFDIHSVNGHYFPVPTLRSVHLSSQSF